MSPICIITSCPAPHRAVRDGTYVRPNHRLPAATGSLVIVLLYHVGQQAEKACAFDRLCQFALLLRRHRGDAARHDFAALRNIALQKLDILVVDLWRVGAGEWAGLTTPEEGTARAALRRKCHGLFLHRDGFDAFSVIAFISSRTTLPPPAPLTPFIPIPIRFPPHRPSAFRMSLRAD